MKTSGLKTEVAYISMLTT